MKWIAITFVAALACGWWSGGLGQGGLAAVASSPPTASGKATPVRSSRVPDEIRARVQPLRDAKTRADRLREVVILASNLPIADIERWYQGNYVEFLDGQLESLFYAILDERWMEADPAGCAQWMAKRGGKNLTPFLARWLEADEAAALEFVRNRPIKQTDAAVISLVRAMSGRDTGKALALVDEFAGRVQLPRELLGEISLKDREAVLAHVEGWNVERKLEALTSLAGAWVGKDMGWVVATLQREGVNEKGFEDLVNHMEWGEAAQAILRNVDKIPEEWLVKMVDASNSALTLGNELEWLAQKPGTSQVPGDLLQRIQEKAANSWWYAERRTKGQELVTAGDWLPMTVRTRIAAMVVEGWKEDPEAARAWADSLPEPLKGATAEGFDAMENDLARQKIAGQLKTPAGLMEALQGDLKGINLHRVGAEWDDAEMAQAAALAGKMDPAKAAEVVGIPGSTFGNLPRDVGGALLIQAMAGDEPSRDFRQMIYKMASRWAGEDPQWAGAWVQRLPEGEDRVWAAKNVAFQWSRYSPAEARAWAGKLPAAEKAAALEALE